MKKRSLQERITAFILTLCLAATLMPISAFSDGVNYISKINVSYEHIDYKAGDTPRTTAAVSNADAHCTVAYEYWREIYQKEEGGVGQAQDAIGIPTLTKWQVYPLTKG